MRDGDSDDRDAEESRRAADWHAAGCVRRPAEPGQGHALLRGHSQAPILPSVRPPGVAAPASPRPGDPFLSGLPAAIFCILAWRIFWLTMMNRSAPEALPGLALTVTEISILDRIRPDKRASPKPSLAHYLNKIASLGGYLARAHDPPPGNIVMWRGWQKLSDIAIGVALERELVGN
jgi:hypothetical protein